MLVYSSKFLVPMGYTYSDFQGDRDTQRSTSGYVSTLYGGAISWRSVKQLCIVDSTMEAEYVATLEVGKRTVWLWKFLTELKVVPCAKMPIVLYCDNSGVVHS